MLIKRKTKFKIMRQLLQLYHLRFSLKRGNAITNEIKLALGQWDNINITLTCIVEQASIISSCDTELISNASTDSCAAVGSRDNMVSVISFSWAFSCKLCSGYIGYMKLLFVNKVIEQLIISSLSTNILLNLRSKTNFLPLDFSKFAQL